MRVTEGRHAASAWSDSSNSKIGMRQRVTAAVVLVDGVTESILPGFEVGFGYRKPASSSYFADVGARNSVLNAANT